MALEKPSDYFKKGIANANDLVEDKELSKRLISPRILFGSDELKSEEIVVSEIKKEENIQEEVEIENIKEEINVESFLTNLSDDVNSLKKTVENTKKYNKEIKFLKKYVKTLEDEISSNESFDPSDLYENIKILKRDVEKVKSEIPEIPEPILYDEQLENLKEIIFNVKESIPIIPEIKYYDDDLSDLIESVEKVKSQVEEFPEVKYYDYQITSIEEKIAEIKESIPKIPEIKYYDEDIVYLEEKINDVKSSIPKYYDEEIINIENKIEELKDTINNLPVLPEVKYYDDDIEKLLVNLSEIKLTIKELPEPKYYEEEFELFDQKIESIKKLIPESQVIPEIKYYDEEIFQLKEDITALSEKISSIKIPDSKKYTDKLDSFYREFDEKNSALNEKIKCLEEIFEYFNESQNQVLEESLEESIITEPSEVKNEDPLTPLNRNFVTFKDLQEHYRLFINRVQQQLSTIGGGGETRLEFLDDVDRNSAKTNGYVLQYDSSVGKFIGTSYVSGSGGDSYWSNTNAGIYTTGNVAIGTDVVSTGSTALWVQGDARITGILSVGTGTITLDPTENTIRVGTGITLDATNNIVSIGNAITLNSNTGVIEVEGSTIGSPTGDAFYTGIVTASAFVGDGSGLTGIVAAGSGVEVKDNNTLVGTASTLNFGTDLDVTLAGGVASINVSIPLSALTDVNTSNLSGITTDYLMVYDPSVPGFKFVNPKTYFGINNDFNPAPDIVDYGAY